jgi:hypothetical protein
MFEKTSKLAEKLATGVSRRGFLGTLGQWAGATALGLAGVLTTASCAQANTYACCAYLCAGGKSYIRCLPGATCDPPKIGCALFESKLVSDCKACSCKKCTGGGGA